MAEPGLSLEKGIFWDPRRVEHYNVRERLSGMIGSACAGKVVTKVSFMG